MTLSASARSIAIELAPAAAGTRELRRLPFRRLSFRTGQRCTYQAAMHGPFIVARAFVALALVLVLVLGSGRNFLGVLNNWFFRKRRLLDGRGLGERLGR
jgi:hypothetical protein